MEYKRNDMVECKCGKQLLFGNMKSHVRTNQHKRRMTLAQEDRPEYYVGFNYKCRDCATVLADTGEGMPCDRCKNKHFEKYSRY